MSSYPTTSRVLERRGLGRVLPPVDDALKADGSAKRVVVNAAENEYVTADGLTLDDFGGRSDALGG